MTSSTGTPTNRDLLMPYAVPYLAYIGLAVLVGQEWISRELSYILKIIIVPLLLFWAWKWYVPVKGPRSTIGSIIWGAVFGILGLAAWLILMAPFIDVAGESWTGSAFILRLLAASLIVPVFEEYLMRGYIFRVAFQWDEIRKQKIKGSAIHEALDNRRIDDVAPGAWSVAAVIISTVAFTVGHLTVEWPAAVVYSILMSILWIVRKDLLSCMVAHGVTNFSLALYVYFTGHWGFW